MASNHNPPTSASQVDGITRPGNVLFLLTLTTLVLPCRRIYGNGVFQWKEFCYFSTFFCCGWQGHFMVLFLQIKSTDLSSHGIRDSSYELYNIV
jgi:hypothetical protein